MACVLLGAVLAGCSGDDGGNETPASFDPIELALVRVEPADGESSVPRNRVIRMIFNTTVLPESVNDQSIRVRTGGTFQTRPPGSFLISGNVVEFDPRLTEAGGPNAIGFEAGVQVLLEVPLFTGGGGEPADNFLQNIEGNPIGIASGDNQIAFTTGSGWDDPVPGPPGVLGLEFVPAPNAVGQVPANAAVTVIFNEPIDPSTVVLGKNVFLTNNTDTAPNFQQDIPSITFFDGSLTRYTFLPVFGFGQGPFNIKVNFIDPDDPESFSPGGLPSDLGGNQVQNFTFLQTFDTQFDPSTLNTSLIREDFTTLIRRDAPNTDALWGDDAQFPFELVSQVISTRNVQIDIVAISAGGATTQIDNAPTATPTGSNPGNEDYCPTANPLVGPDLNVIAGPPTSAGRRQMNLYRRQELGPSGTVIRIAWGPDSDATFAATYDDFNMRIGHKRALTSLSTGTLFSQFDVDGFVNLVTNVSYKVPQALDINGAPINDGYLNWPSLKNFFEYDGVNELLLDIEAQEGNTFQTFRTFLAVSAVGGATCNCVTIFQGACNVNNSAGLRQADSAWGSDVLNPAGNVALGIFNPAPFVHVMEFELAKLRSDAQSTYYDTGTPAPDFLSPIINPLVQNGGATVTFTWSASADGIIEEVPFTPNINACDGFRYLRWHAVLRANIFTGARARVALLEVPYTFE